MDMDEISIEYFREEFLLRYEVNITEIPAKAVLAYNPSDGSVRWWNVMSVLNIYLIVNTLYCIMIYCGWNMHKGMEEKVRNFSEILKNQHKQFYKALVLQV